MLLGRDLKYYQLRFTPTRPRAARLSAWSRVPGGAVFWESVLDGFRLFTHWETYAAGILFAGLVAIPNVLSAFVLARGGAVGCLTVLVIDPVLRAFPTLIFVFTMLPILIGISDDAAWTFPWLFLYHEPWAMFKAILLLVGASIVLGFIPLLGRMVSLYALLLGGIALVISLGALKKVNPSLPLERLDLLPGFFQIIGFIVISAVATWLGMLSTFVTAWIITAIASRGYFDEPNNPAIQIVTFLIAPVFGFIPVLIYGAWLGNQLRMLH